MNCKLDVDYIQAYVDETLSSVEKIIIEEHLKVCESCKTEVEELKLLFSKLDSLSECDIDIPQEAAHIRIKVINEYINTENTTKFGLKEYMNTQKQVFKKAGTFLEFMPGVKPGASYIEKGIRKTPSLLFKAVEGALAGGKRLALMRAQV